MEITCHETQTPLFPPYVNFMNKKDHWKIGESEHNTDCDVTVRITNSYAPMASHFDFYSFSGYEFLISTIQFLLVKMLILDIRNYISTSNNVNFWYQQFNFH